MYTRGGDTYQHTGTIRVLYSAVSGSTGTACYQGPGASTRIKTTTTTTSTAPLGVYVLGPRSRKPHRSAILNLEHFPLKANARCLVFKRTAPESPRPPLYKEVEGN